MSEKPERAIVFELKIEADNEQALINALDNLAFIIKSEGLSLSSVSGGYSWSHVYNVKHNAISHDEYFEKIKEMLAKEK